MLDADDRATRTECARAEGRVEFRGVTFGYDPGRPVLTDISFVVEPGSVRATAANRRS
jgi:ATP-binding cassette subfamily B protein